jgi:hypothetical protein
MSIANVYNAEVQKLPGMLNFSTFGGLKIFKGYERSIYRFRRAHPYG